MLENESIFVEPISKVLVNLGFCSARSVRNFIKNNQILLNSKRITDFSFPVQIEKDELCVNQKIIEKQNHIYIMLNKPEGYVCSHKSDRHPVVYDLISCVNTQFNLEKLGKIHSVGRLDCDSCGLLLLTTNGSFSHKITSPDFKIEKKYFVRLKNPVKESEKEEYKNIFKSGVVLPPEKKFLEQKAQPAFIDFISETECFVTICEGMFHQVRRMFLALKNEVVFLERFQIGGLTLDKNLLPGEFKFLSKNEIEKKLI